MANYKSTAVVSTVYRLGSGSNGKWVMYVKSKKDGQLDFSQKFVEKLNLFATKKEMDSFYASCKAGDIIEYEHWNNGAFAPIRNISYDSNKKIENFINQEKQDAVVTGCMQFQPKDWDVNRTHVECWSPVWKEIEFDTPRIDIRRGDRLTLTRKKIDNTNQYNYKIKENHSVNKIIQDVGIDEILKDFSEAERNNLLLLADQIRLGLVK